MARFVYRLQKVYELRERKKKEKEEKLIEARARVKEIEAQIEAVKTEIKVTRQNMFKADHMLMTVHDNYIDKLHHDLDRLYEELEIAKQAVVHAQRELQQATAEFEAIVKHEEKAKEEWIEEQKRIEMKQLDEVASQRFFRNKIALEEEEQELEKEREEN